MSVVEQVTWKHILAFVTEVHTKEGAKPNPSHYQSLFRECLAHLFRVTEAYRASWTNAAGDVLSLSEYTVLLPIDCLKVTRVEWNGTDNELGRSSVEELDYLVPGWRTATGEPSYYAIESPNLILDSSPSDAVGKLVARGFGYPGDDEALTYFPIDVQLAPARYILKELPSDPAIPMQRARYVRSSQGWAIAEPRILAALRDRTTEDFTYP